MEEIDFVFYHFVNLLFLLQQQIALNRMNIVPEALLFEAPRPRTEDVKPGMSNIKVSWKNFAQISNHSRQTIILSVVPFPFQIFLILLLGMIVAVVATIFGIMYYQQRKESSRKLW